MFSYISISLHAYYRWRSNISLRFSKESGDVDTYTCFITVLWLTPLLWVAVLRINSPILPHICFANDLLHIWFSNFRTHTLNMNHSQPTITQGQKKLQHYSTKKQFALLMFKEVLWVTVFNTLQIVFVHSSHSP